MCFLLVFNAFSLRCHFFFSLMPLLGCALLSSSCASCALCSSYSCTRLLLFLAFHFFHSYLFLPFFSLCLLLSQLVAFLLLSLVLLCPFLLRRPDNKPISSLGFLSFLLHRFLPSLLLDCSLPCVLSFTKCPSDDWARFFPLPSSQQLQNLFFFITFRHLFLRDPTWPGGVPPAPMFGAIRTRSSPLSLVSFCFPL